MYYPDDDTLVIERKDVEDTETEDDEDDDTDDDTSSSSKRYKGYCFGRLNPDLLLCKVFYFTFYGSYGSLYPLIAIYFKQLGLSASQSGILLGVRPFVEFCAAPMWGAVADSWRKAKFILLLSLSSWLLFTEGVAFIQPAKSTCVFLNSTKPNTTFVVVGSVREAVNKQGDSNVEITNVKDSVVKSVFVANKKTPEGESDYRIGNSRSINETSTSKNDVLVQPQNIDTGATHKTAESSNGLDKSVTIIKYKYENTELIFILLLLLMIIGEFFSSPTITLADSATLGYLGHQRMELYGRQRMFGSLAWGLIMFIEGLILERTKTITIECDGQVTEERENYMICFGTYAVLITCAFFVATQLNFNYQSVARQKLRLSKPHKNPGKGASEIIMLKDVNAGTLESSEEKSSEQPADEDEPRYSEVVRMFASVRYGTVLYVVWFAGFGFGFLFTFLYWHLKELGGPPTLFGVASIINHSSEVMGYFFSSWLIQKLGYIPMLCLGLLCFAVRFIVISWLVNPWWVLTVETLQGN